MNESRAWLSQARADFVLGSAIAEQNVPFCYPIAKFQQSVEKAVKGLVVALAAAKILSIHVGRRHEVEPYVSAMVRLRRSPARKSIHNAIQRLFGADVRVQIGDLDSLVPKWPPPDVAPSRNTEYPFQDSKHQWRVPVQPGVFNRAEADAYRQLAARIVAGCGRIVSAIERRPN